MEIRLQQLSEIKKFTKNVNNEFTMLLQSLQWDRKHLLEGSRMVTCKYDQGHRLPSEIKRQRNHENKCFMSCHGYRTENIILPDAPTDSNTVIRLSAIDTTQIINEAATADPLFKRGQGCEEPQPLTLDRLQSSFTAHERRAIHDTVVKAAPSCHDLTELDLPNLEATGARGDKSREQILAELRDMKRRRAKYRVAPKTRNYSAVLRDVIATQMELYTEAHTKVPIKKIKTEKIEDDPSAHVRSDRSYKERYSEDKRTNRQYYKERKHRDRDSNSHFETAERDRYKDKQRKQVDRHESASKRGEDNGISSRSNERNSYTNSRERKRYYEEGERKDSEDRKGHHKYSSMDRRKEERYLQDSYDKFSKHVERDGTGKRSRDERYRDDKRVTKRIKREA